MSSPEARHGAPEPIFRGWADPMPAAVGPCGARRPAQSAAACWVTVSGVRDGWLRSGWAASVIICSPTKRVSSSRPVAIEVVGVEERLLWHAQGGVSIDHHRAGIVERRMDLGAVFRQQRAVRVAPGEIARPHRRDHEGERDVVAAQLLREPPQGRIAGRIERDRVAVPDPVDDPVARHLEQQAAVRVERHRFEIVDGVAQMADLAASASSRPAGRDSGSSSTAPADEPEM